MCEFCEKIKEYGAINTEDFLLEDGLLYNPKTKKYYIALNDAWRDYYADLEITFCPMCGRKLGEETEN